MLDLSRNPPCSRPSMSKAAPCHCRTAAPSLGQGRVRCPARWEGQTSYPGFQQSIRIGSARDGIPETVDLGALEGVGYDNAVVLMHRIVFEFMSTVRP